MIEDDVRSFILDELGWRGRADLTDDYPLLERGILDSIGVFHVVAFVEGEYGIEIADEEIEGDHFSSLASIARLVATKQDGSVDA